MSPRTNRNASGVIYNTFMSQELAGWRYLFDYEGQHPSYCELDDPDMPVGVMIYGQGNKRQAVSKVTGEVVFTYQLAPRAIERMRKGIPSGNAFFEAM